MNATQPIAADSALIDRIADAITGTTVSAANRRMRAIQVLAALDRLGYAVVAKPKEG